MDGLTMLAQYKSAIKCTPFHAISPLSSTGQAVIQFLEVENTHGIQLSCGNVITALTIIFQDLNIKKNQWGELTFDILWDDVKIAGGNVMKLPPIKGEERATA